MTQVVILGAGIAGLSSAWLLKQRGIDFLVLEKQSYPGGLARSFEWHGFHCDFAAHRLFTSNETVLQLLLNLVPMGRQIRRSRIYLRGHWMRDPLDVLELAQKLTFTERLGVLGTYLFRPKKLEETDFENYVLRRYGRYLYRIFFQPYTEKLFGIPGNQISVLWARQKVRLANPLDNLRENTKTKFQYFYYPIRGGYGAIVDRLYEEVKDHVLLNARVSEMETVGSKITSVSFEKDGERRHIAGEAVISSLPLTLTMRMLGHSFNGEGGQRTPMHRLQFQKVDAVYLLVNKPFVSDDHWIYFMDADIAINRLVEFKNMSQVDTPTDKTVVCAEVTQHHLDPVNKVIEDLHKCGLVERSEILDTKVLREEFAYPVYSQEYEGALQSAQDLLQRYDNLYVVGRAAEFRHREVDDNLDAAIHTVEHLVHHIPVSAPRAIEERAMEGKPSQPKIVAVILAYNHYEDTHECLQSLLATQFQGLEIVVVDNGSNDQTPEKVGQDFLQVQVIENGQNLGVPAGYNVGFTYALQNQADYILMLNNDTVVAADMITRLLTQAESDPQAGIIMPQVLFYGSSDHVWSSGGRYRRFPPSILFHDTRAKVTQASVRLIEYAPSCGLLIHRRAFERAGLFDPGYFFLFDDWDFSERVRAHGLHIWFVRQAVMWHKVSRTTQGPRSALYWYTMGASITRFYRRHGRPVWLSLSVHAAYMILREFLWKRNWAYWGDFWRGFKEGLQRPLGNFPPANSSPSSS